MFTFWLYAIKLGPFASPLIQSHQFSHRESWSFSSPIILISCAMNTADQSKEKIMDWKIIHIPEKAFFHT